MKKILHISFCLFLHVILFSTINYSYAQEKQSLIQSYTDYHKTAREIAYVHLNKSTYVLGEDIGFKAYVLDKRNKKASLLTTNLYVSIEDIKGNVIKQKLIRVENGIASNVFEIDSVFKPGDYNIKAYTNWMLNFDEKNYYTESIQILDIGNKNKTQELTIEKNIDAQFLPESGHLLDGVVNIVGVTVKNEFGHGIPYTQGEVLDNKNRIITTFKTNQFGIGNFQLLPEISNSYTTKIKTQNKEYTYNLNLKTEKEGIILNYKKLKNKAILSLITNKATLPNIKNKRHTLMIHNGNNFDIMDVYFTDNTEVSKVIDYNNVPTGINIVTLFNEEDIPIAERLFFNFQGIDIINSSSITQIKSRDSITLNLGFKNIIPNLKNSISISILPQETKSYNKDSNIISYTYLEPYINGKIEQSKYYFSDTDSKKEYDLDNLLITQGWSSYSWKTIFEGSPDLSHQFEKGISVKANATSKDFQKNGELSSLMYYLNKDGFKIAQANNEDSHYWIHSLYPEEGSTLKISKTTPNEGLKPAKLYLQFFPRTIPFLKVKDVDLIDNTKQNFQKQEFSYVRSNFFKNLKNVQELKEVLVTSSPILEKRLKQHKLSTGRFGKVTVIDKQDEASFVRLTDYITYRILNEYIRYKDTNDSSLQIERYSINYFLDDVLLTDIALLDGLYVSDIESIEFNRFGVGDGFRSPNGFIKIYTKKIPTTRYEKQRTKVFSFPLTFSPEKSYYVPKYRYYTDDFYKEYGVVDWKPKLIVDEKGIISFKIAKPRVPLSLYIEGIANDGSLIFEEKNILLE